MNKFLYKRDHSRAEVFLWVYAYGCLALGEWGLYAVGLIGAIFIIPLAQTRWRKDKEW